MTDIKLKCYDCGSFLPPQFFSRDRSHKTGKRSICRACAAARFRDWYLLNASSVVRRVLRNRERKCVINVAAVEHTLDSRIDGKSPLRVFYELSTRVESEDEDNA